ncbi:MAG: hypothetical protein QE487_15895 [Fluviicola sp.]|nr:hypothetical protein [Fluviicola sp.]
MVIQQLLNISLFLLLFFKGIVILFNPHHFNLLFANGQLAQIIVGSILILSSLIPLIPRKLSIKLKLHFIYVLSFLALFIHTLTTFIDAKYVPEQFIEHALQLFLPIIALSFLLSRRQNLSNYTIPMKMLVALTFIGHGIYALGVHYVPDNFISMSGNILEINQRQSIAFLFTVGLLDLLFSITMFIKPLEKISLYYMFIWGALTSVARLWYGFDTHATFTEIIVNYLPNTLYRAPHAIIPLILLIQFHNKQHKSSVKLIEQT